MGYIFTRMDGEERERDSVGYLATCIGVTVHLHKVHVCVLSYYFATICGMENHPMLSPVNDQSTVAERTSVEATSVSTHLPILRPSTIATSLKVPS